MGHLAAKDAYDPLRRKLDRWPVGAPGQETIREILRTVYTPDEAALAAKLPFRFTGLDAIARRLKMPASELKPRLEALADKGLVLDFRLGGKQRYMLTPTIVGFFEFSMMRLRDDIDQKKLARLLHTYLIEEPDFSRQFAPGSRTSPFRTLLHESVLPPDFTEVLDWERASQVVEGAGGWAVGLCHCRHVAHHHDRDCRKFRLESCLSLGSGADYLTRHGIARGIDKSEALALLTESREAGMVHICDNVKHRPTFLCTCCGCCCEILLGFKKFKTFGNTFSSSFEARSDPLHCTGCKKCQKACPVDAVSLLSQLHSVNGKQYRFLAQVDPEVCIGCGVCALQCRFSSMHMSPRGQRPITPANTFARILHMAIEQGKLHHLLLDADSGMTAQAASAVLGVILKLPPAKQLLAQDAFRSRFVNFLLRQVR